jgi:hypothetical protein
MLTEKLIEKLIHELKLTEVAALFIEDPYRLQTVIDDHQRHMEEFATAAKKLVAEIEGA